MGVHAQLVLLLAVQGVVLGSRIRHDKKPLTVFRSPKSEIKAPLAEQRARPAGHDKQTDAAAELHGSFRPKHAVNGDAQTSLYGTHTAKVASLVENKASSSHTLQPSNSVLVNYTLNKVSSTKTLGAKWKLSDAMSAAPVKGMTTKGNPEQMQMFKSGADSSVVVAGITGFLVIVFCICYCCSSCLFRGKGGSQASKMQRPEPRAKIEHPISFERTPYIYEGREVFDWEQSSSTITLYIKVPDGLLKNDLDIKFSPHHLHIGTIGDEPFMKEEVYDTVNAKESGWRLCSDGELQIMLRKDDSSVWPRVLK